MRKTQSIVELSDKVEIHLRDVALS